MITAMGIYLISEVGFVFFSAISALLCSFAFPVFAFALVFPEYPELSRLLHD